MRGTRFDRDSSLPTGDSRCPARTLNELDARDMNVARMLSIRMDENTVDFSVPSKTGAVVAGNTHREGANDRIERHLHNVGGHEIGDSHMCHRESPRPGSLDSTDGRRSRYWSRCSAGHLASSPCSSSAMRSDGARRRASARQSDCRDRGGCVVLRTRRFILRWSASGRTIWGHGRFALASDVHSDRTRSGQDEIRCLGAQSRSTELSTAGSAA